MTGHIIEVEGASARQRLDLFLMEFAASTGLGLSRTAIQHCIVSGRVSVDGRTVHKASFKVSAGSKIVFEPEAAKTDPALVGEDIPLDVVYEDEDIAVINKPAGLVVHPAPGNAAHTMVHAMLNRFGTLSDINPHRPGIVHRLDKETSGLIVIARNNAAHHALAKQFADHSIKRKYVALVKGRVEYDENVIELSIGRHPTRREHMAVHSGVNARYAKTRYRTIKRTDTVSLLELEPYTGRTHQLRVHLSYIGHPIMGDAKYGRQAAFPRMALHAKYLGFMHPSSGKFIEFETGTPKEFSDAVRSKESS
ncbi:MAG TPA: RluA family pseudouridine synthase [Candidatus Omnitrophota bacterium]|nr:RluA family pseudouridine synthase [Candidatus Omnitrophota bacterium]HQJ15922.1 RluA family pseudouridine synthase [Candidatus Omnitrophota bacterium]